LEGSIAVVILAHRIALDPTFRQRAYFVRAAGTARFTWNWALAEWTRRSAAGDKPTAQTLKAGFNALKYEAFPWLKDIHRDAHAQPFANLHKAFTAYFKGDAQRPTFKKKGKCRDSFYVANDKLRLDGYRLRLPVVGWVHLREQLRFTGKIVAAVVSREADRWFVSIQVDVGNYQQPTTGAGELGIDVGLTAFATLSTGEKIAAPKPLRRALGQLRRCGRKVSRRQRGSARRERAKHVLARVHARVTNLRRDYLHKLSTRLCRENQALGVESIAVKNMLQNHKLALSIADAGWAEFVRLLRYKGRIFACRVAEAPRFYPSSKRCHGCGCVKENLALCERIFICEACGLVCDRDVNAALNLVPQALREVTVVDSTVRPGLPTGSEDEATTIPCALFRTK
jgi:putative transposase